jgi:hypothetical protein
VIILTFLITIIVSIVSLILIFINGIDYYFTSFIFSYMYIAVFITIFAVCVSIINRNKKMRLVSYVKKNKDTIYYREPPFSYSPVL